jgi:hypothetical protein
MTVEKNPGPGKRFSDARMQKFMKKIALKKVKYSPWTVRNSSREFNQ